MTSHEVPKSFTREYAHVHQFFVVVLLVCLAAPGAAIAARPDKPPGGGSKPPPSPPDIVYMSADNRSVSSAAEVRGVTLSTDGLSATDRSLQKNTTGRDYRNVAWSPDGTQYAWIENNGIMAATPGQKPRLIYRPTPGGGSTDIIDNPDSLAWGPGCADGTSVIVFLGASPWDFYFLSMQNGSSSAPVALTKGTVSPIGALAFSPTGEHLAFTAGNGTTWGIFAAPMCTADRTPYLLLEGDTLGGTYDELSVLSMDWSRHGDRLAISLVTGPDPEFDWRDLAIVELNYSMVGGELVYGSTGSWLVDLDYMFTAESSEHSPQWGPSESGAGCQRLAFSQSSNTAPRSLYILDINDGHVGDCEINSPLQLSAKNPRAIDWK